MDGRKISAQEYEIYKSDFDDCDRDGSGALDPNEAKDLLKLLSCQLERDPTDGEVKDFMQSIDKDENGKISFKEYMQWVLGDNWWVDGRVNSDGAMVQSGVSDANVMFQGKLWRLQKDDSKRKTKVVATLGPASWTEEMLPKMINAGANIFRLNCSHRRGGVFEELYPRLRKTAQELGKHVEVLGDLQGPKFRIGEVDGDVNVAKGEIVEFALMKDENDLIRPGRITMKDTLEQNALLKGLTIGMEFLIEDGRRKLKVTERVSDSEVKAEVLVGGRIKARQGVNVPDLEISTPALTKKDVEDAEYMLKLDPPLDYIAVSFPQRGQDLQELIDIMDRLNIPGDKRPKIMPKIEKPQALTNLDDLIAKAGSLMVARGDLGVECGPEPVPFAQKFMIEQAKAKGLFVVNATQMLESMIKNAVPTRAEANDVANAVWDGADAVMLSGEAAIGQFPLETVNIMASIARTADAHKQHLNKPIKY